MQGCDLGDGDFILQETSGVESHPLGEAREPGCLYTSQLLIVEAGGGCEVPSTAGLLLRQSDELSQQEKGLSQSSAGPWNPLPPAKRALKCEGV